MKKNYSRLLFFIVISILSYNCSDDYKTSKEAETKRINEKVNIFVKNKMDSLYLWADMLPENMNIGLEPKSFFNRLLYTRLDKWSFITDDYEGLMASFEGIEKTFGYSLALGLVDNSNYVGVIQYVYPESIAAKAGLKRGDVIYKMDGKLISKEDSQKLISSDKINITYGNITDGKIKEEATVNLISENYIANPILLSKIIEKDGHKIGYLCYTKFILNAKDKLNEVFKVFKEENITDFVLDLRYNRGGSVAASKHICSSILSKENAINKDVFISMTYNKLVKKDLEENKNTEISKETFIEVENNLNMKNLYVLTGPSSASASELTITALQSYINVFKIGGTTSGKYVASITVRPNVNANNKEIQNWAIQPIVLKYANANGVTDFRKGLIPDIEVEDDLLSGTLLGDENEELLKKAIETITGVSSGSKRCSTSIASEKSYNKHSFIVVNEISSIYDRFYNTINFNDVLLRK